MEYTLELKSEEDYNIIKKILKAFDGATIRPTHPHTPHLEEALQEARNGDCVGPFNSVQDLMADLLS